MALEDKQCSSIEMCGKNIHFCMSTSSDVRCDLIPSQAWVLHLHAWTEFTRNGGARVRTEVGAVSGVWRKTPLIKSPSSGSPSPPTLYREGQIMTVHWSEMKRRQAFHLTPLCAAKEATSAPCVALRFEARRLVKYHRVLEENRTHRWPLKIFIVYLQYSYIRKTKQVHFISSN